jgi:aminomethyltransferase
MCNERGGTVDDLITFRTDAIDWLLVVNASRVEADRAWIEGRLGEQTEMVDHSGEVALLAVQGPQSEAALQPSVTSDLSAVKKNGWIETRCCDAAVGISRTGYTGEDGFEVFLEQGDAERVWNQLVAVQGVTPCGLGARDVLRLEAGLSLYGHELSEEISPLEAGLEWTVKLAKDSFVGRETLSRQQREGLRRGLAGIGMLDRSVPRDGYPVATDGVVVGRISSGTFSTTLDRGIALAFLPPELGQPGTAVSVLIRERAHAAEVVRIPFIGSPWSPAEGTVRET